LVATSAHHTKRSGERGQCIQRFGSGSLLVGGNESVKNENDENGNPFCKLCDGERSHRSKEEEEHDNVGKLEKKEEPEGSGALLGESIGTVTKEALLSFSWGESHLKINL
jgi:hypothetical protein